METVAELKALARAALEAGNLDEAERLTRKAHALKSLEGLDEPAPAPVAEPTKAAPVDSGVRLPFVAGSATPEPEPTEAPAAIKSWYVRKYGGDVEAGAQAIARDLYGCSYEQAAYYKNADFRRYLRTGKSDDRLASMVLLTPSQIVDAWASSAEVGAIKSTMVEANDSLGGYVVPEDVRMDIIARLPGATVVRPLANVITTSRDKVSMPKETGGNSRYQGASRVSWVDETPSGTATNTNMTFGQVPIPVHTAMADLQLSKNLTEDAAFDLVGYLQRRLIADFAIDEDEQFLVGSGVGRPQGILNGTAANGAPFDSDITVVNSGSAAALTADTSGTKGILPLPYNLAQQYRQRAVWVYAAATALAIRALKDSQNRYLWSTQDGQLGDAQMQKLLGYAIHESEAMPAVAANKYPIIFGDFSGYTIADRIGLSIMRYEDFTTARQNLVGFVARRRVGGQVTEGYKFVAQKVAA